MFNVISCLLSAADDTQHGYNPTKQTNSGLSWTQVSGVTKLIWTLVIFLRPRPTSKCHRWRKWRGIFSSLSDKPKRIKTHRSVINHPPLCTHTHSHTHTPSEKKRWVSVTPSEPQRNMIIASDRLYSPVPRGISLNQQPLLLINLYIYILIYTSFLYLGKTIRHITKNMILRVDFLHEGKETNAKN